MKLCPVSRQYPSLLMVVQICPAGCLQHVHDATVLDVLLSFVKLSCLRLFEISRRSSTQMIISDLEIIALQGGAAALPGGVDSIVSSFIVGIDFKILQQQQQLF